MIVKAPTRATARPTRPRPAVDLACAEIILSNPDVVFQKVGSLMDRWARMIKEKEDNASK